MAELHGSKILVSVEEAIQALSLGRTKLMELTYAGRIPSVKIGKRRLYPLDELSTWARAQVTAGVIEAIDIDNSDQKDGKTQAGAGKAVQDLLRDGEFSYWEKPPSPKPTRVRRRLRVKGGE